MNLLFIHETEYVEKMIFEYQIIPEILSSCGHNVTVIDYPSKWPNHPVSVRASLKTQVLHNVRRADKQKGITLIRPGFLHIPVVSRSMAFISYFSLIDRTIKEKNIDCIILFAAPTNGLQTLWAARKNNTPVLFRLLDVLHQLVPHRLLSSPTLMFEKFIYPRVDKILAITPRMRDYAVRYGASEDRCDYVPSGSDADLFRYQPKDAALLEQYGLKAGDIILLFAGTLYNFSGLDQVIEALPRYLPAMPDLRLLIIGSGEQEERLRRLVAANHLENVVVFTGFVQYPDLPRYINLADICINPFEINVITNSIFPGKIYQYLACEKPVIATKLQGMLDIFPCTDTESHIYYSDTMEEFFNFVQTIDRGRFEDANPSLQKIASIMECEIERLVMTNRAHNSRSVL